MKNTYTIASVMISAAMLLPGVSLALSHAQYADLVSIDVGPQVGTLKAGQNTSATYLITVTRTGFGDRYADLSFSGLVNVEGTFSRNPIEFQAPGPTGQFNTATSTLTLTTNPATPRQSLCFTVTAQGQNSISSNQCVSLSGHRSFLSILTGLFSSAPTTKKVPTVSTINILTGKIGTVR